MSLSDTMSHEAVELLLSIETDGPMVELILSYRKALMNRHAQGKFDLEKAAKGFAWWVTEGAKRYCKEYCSADTKYYHIFDKQCREEVQAQLAEQAQAALECGDWVS